MVYLQLQVKLLDQNENIITTFVSISVFCQQTICKEEQLFIAMLHQKIKTLKLRQTAIHSAASPL